MQIELDLSRHCIETASRLRMEALIRAYFKTPLPETDRAIRALTRFLEQADFQGLRHAMAREGSPSPATAVLHFPRDLTRMEVRFGPHIFHPLSQAKGP